jgi:hypothetical protein
MNSPLAVAALALVSVALPACGGAGDSSAKNDKAKFMEAGLKYAQCMRANGVDFPDPPADKGSGSASVVSQKGSPVKMSRADQKCKHFIDDVQPKEISQEQRAKIERHELAWARCMRAEGFDVSDPIVDSRGRVQMRAPAGGVKPDGARWRRATDKCRAGTGELVPTKGGE